MRILKRKFSGQFSYYNNIFNDFLLLIPITSLLYLLTTIFNLSFLFQQQPFLLLLLPLYSINILAIAKNTIFGFQLDKSSKEKLAYYTIFITFLVFYFLYFVASKPKIILAQSGGCGTCSSTNPSCPSTCVIDDTCYYDSYCYCTHAGTCECKYYHSDSTKPICGCSVSGSTMQVFSGYSCNSDGNAITSGGSEGWQCEYTNVICDAGNKNVCRECSGTWYVCDGSSWVIKSLTEVCCDGVDNDCDGKTDLDDPDCSSIECCSDSECSDGNPCTQDTCNNGVCEHSNLADGTVLGTGYCYGSQVGICCSGNLVCAPGGAEKYCCGDPGCNDNNLCTEDKCVNHVCEYTDLSGPAETGNPTDYCCGGSLYDARTGICCNDNWIEGGECCDDPDCASKSCDNGVIPVCKLDTHLCDCPPCTSSEDCAEKNACCDTSSGKCYPEGTIIGNKLCDRPEWILESSLLFKLANENPFSIAE